jgi:hypothetical protein
VVYRLGCLHLYDAVQAPRRLRCDQDEVRVNVIPKRLYRRSFRLVTQVGTDGVPPSKLPYQEPDNPVVLTLLSE